MHDDQPPRLLHALDHRLRVPRQYRAQVDQFDLGGAEGLRDVGCEGRGWVGEYAEGGFAVVDGGAPGEEG